jgi:hypothetical protein
MNVGFPCTPIGIHAFDFRWLQTANPVVLKEPHPFTFTSSTAEQPMVETRSFYSFSEAAEENADSRVQAGIHFRFSTNAGLTMGERIGDRAVDDFLRPD